MQKQKNSVVCLLTPNNRGKAEAVRFIEETPGTVTDTESGLMWQQGHIGPMNWEEAVRHVQEFRLAGYTDWRLPSREELLTIANWQDCPTMDAVMFENAMAYLDWLMTKDAYQTDEECLVYFPNGYGGFNYDFKIYVKCVRGFNVRNK